MQYVAKVAHLKKVVRAVAGLDFGGDVVFPLPQLHAKILATTRQCF